MLGADDVIATRMVEREGGTPARSPSTPTGPTRPTAIRELADRRGYDLARSHAYSDSATDLPMLEAVGHPHAVNPDRALRREAIARGWPVLDFVHPAPLRRRLNGLTDAAGSRPRATATAAAALALTAAVVWAAARRAGLPRDVGTSALGTGQDDRGKFKSRWVYYP